MRLFTIALFILTLSGCSLLSPVKTEPVTTYELSTVPYVKKKASHRITVYVAPMEAISIYNTKEMAYSTHQFQVAYFAQNEWADTPPKMLQPLIIQTLQNTHYFHAVTAYSTNAQPNYILNTQLVKLKQNFTCNSSAVELKINAQITNNTNNQIIATKQISIVIPAPYNSPYGGVLAANRAVAIALKQLSVFCTNVMR